MVAQVVRFWPEYIKIKEMYDAGDFGDVRMVYANRIAQHPTGRSGIAIRIKAAVACSTCICMISILCNTYSAGSKSVYAVGESERNRLLEFCYDYAQV